VNVAKWQRATSATKKITSAGMGVVNFAHILKFRAPALIPVQADGRAVRYAAGVT
jgi:hypothetical protein